MRKFTTTIQVVRPWDTCQTRFETGKLELSYVFPYNNTSCSTFSVFFELLSIPGNIETFRAVHGLNLALWGLQNSSSQRERWEKEVS